MDHIGITQVISDTNYAVMIFIEANFLWLILIMTTLFGVISLSPLAIKKKSKALEVTMWLCKRILLFVCFIFSVTIASMYLLYVFLNDMSISASSRYFGSWLAAMVSTNALVIGASIAFVLASWFAVVMHCRPDDEAGQNQKRTT